MSIYNSIRGRLKVNPLTVRMHCNPEGSTLGIGCLLYSGYFTSLIGFLLCFLYSIIDHIYFGHKMLILFILIKNTFCLFVAYCVLSINDTFLQYLYFQYRFCIYGYCILSFAIHLMEKISSHNFTRWISNFSCGRNFTLITCLGEILSIKNTIYFSQVFHL